MKRITTFFLLFFSMIVGLGMNTTMAHAKNYHFVMVSHMGPNDSNSKWFDLSLKEFEKKFPNVKTDYLATSDYSNQKYVALIEQAIATKPDGLAVAITDPQALDGAVRKAIKMGIPVIAFNTPDPREKGKKIPYMTFVGTDLYLDGVRAGEHAFASAAKGIVPKPKRALCANPDPAHSGLVARCNGFTEAMKEKGVETDTLATDWDPARATNILQSYLIRHKDVNYIYAVTGDSGPTVWNVANQLKLDPDVDKKGMTIIGVDANPVSLSGVQMGHLLSTVSQGFWLQGWEPMAWLYFYHEFGYKPASDILTGPVIIDKNAVDQWVKLIRKTFGAEAYDKQVTW